VAPPSSSSSSSARRVAKLAQRGKGKKVRFQGGTLFPMALIIVMVLGLATIVYARESRPDPGSFPPQVGDHWHAAYGFYVCDTWLPDLTGNLEERVTDSLGNESFVDEEFSLTGVHSHDDGVIHWHPYSTASVGKRARLGLFLDVYDVELSEERLVLPDAQGAEIKGTNTYDVDDFRCDGEEVEIKVVAWDSYTDTGQGQTYITDLEDVALRNDGMVFAIAVVPPGTDVDMPTHAKDLPELGAADGGNVPTTTPDGEPIDTSVPATSGTTAGTSPGDTAPIDTAPADTAPADTAPADTAPATTGG